jgi:Zn-dependent protease with chaperone function
MPTFALDALGALTGRLTWLALIHSLWIGLLVASVGALILQTFSRLSHGMRHTILAVAMLIAAMGPVAAALASHAGLLKAETVNSRPRSTIIVLDGGARRATPSGPESRSGSWDAAENPAPASEGLLGRTMTRVASSVAFIRPFAVWAWGALALILGSVLVLGAFGLRRLAREAQPASRDLQQRSRRLARRLGLRRAPTILVHSRLAEPFLSGVFRTAIFLPRRWLDSASVEAQTAILAHELAHARRRDQLVNLVQRLVDIGLFFHPAVHWLSRSLRRERELCADALAVRLTGDPIALAEALQSVARLGLDALGAPAVGASPGGRSPSLLPRIQELIGMTPSRPRHTVWPYAALPVAGFLALMAAAAGSAEERPVLPDTPAQAGAANDPRTLGEPPSPNAGSRAAGQAPGTAASYGPPARAAGGKTVVSDDRQICYQVRFINSDPEAWRPLLLDRLKLIKQEADVAAWTLDDKALLDLSTLVEHDASLSVRATVNLTAFNAVPATVTDRRKQEYVAGYEKIDDATLPLRPILKTLEIGSKLDISGTIETRGTRLAVEVSDCWLLGYQTMLCKERVGAELVAAEYHVPSSVDRKCQVDLEIPKGSHLLISLGLSSGMKKPTSGAAALVNDAFAWAGLPEPMGVVRFERLVVVTPKPIILESDERPVPSATRVKAGRTE